MNDSVRELGSVVGLFIMVGIGLGLAGAIVLTQLDTGGAGSGAGMVTGLVFLQAVSVMYFTGPAVGAVGGVLAGLRSKDSAIGALGGGVGSFLGFYAMFVVAFLLMTVIASQLGSGGNGSGGMSLMDNITVVAAVGVPTGVVGATTGLIAGVRGSSGGRASRVNW